MGAIIQVLQQGGYDPKQVLYPGTQTSKYRGCLQHCVPWFPNISDWQVYAALNKAFNAHVHVSSTMCAVCMFVVIADVMNYNPQMTR